MDLRFGLGNAVPSDISCAWGARMILPDDLLPDRQGNVGSDADLDALHDWLNSGPLQAARKEARRLVERFELLPSDEKVVVLYEDDRGIIKASPNASFGYLYVAAWLKVPAIVTS